MIQIDALGKPCPIPVIETKKAIKVGEPAWRNRSLGGQ